MRQIKFRAWYAPEKTMMYQDALTDENKAQAFWGYIAHLDNPPIMQFTGLLDKNGKEIYEGDIVKSEQWTPTTYQVAFDRGAFYLAFPNLREAADITYAESFEVIGNIYENPELCPSKTT